MFDSFVRRVLVGAVLVLSLAVTSAPVFAQPPAPTPAEPVAESADNPEDQPVILDEIFVTPQKREENIQLVPLSMSTLDSDQLQTISVGGGDVRILAGRVPSLVIESSFGRAFPRFYIRGLGNTDFDLNASQPVSMVVDDIVLENPVVKGMPLWDLDHVEVLRGPQGTLFGRNTPAGVVKFDTKKPAQAREGYVSASYGTFGNREVQAAFGGALTPTLSGRASLLYQAEDDWIDNAFTGKKNALGGYDTKAWRAQLLWQPNDDFDGLLNLHGWDLDGTARIFRANILKPGTNDLVDGFDQGKVALDGKNEQNISSHGAALKLNYDLGEATLTSVTGYESLDMYSRGDVDGGFGCAFCGGASGPGFIPFIVETADGIPNLDQYTEELRIASNSGGVWDYLAGFYYFDEKLRVDTFGFNSLAPGNPSNGDVSYQKQHAKSWALFGSLDYRPNESWALKGGLRYTKDEKDFSAARIGNNPTIRPIVEKTDADLVTGDLSATFKVDEDTNIYGRIGTGFRAPSIQGRIGFCPSDTTGGTDKATDCVSVAGEEKIRSVEVGVKSEFLDRRLRTNLALYQYQLDDQQLVAVGGAANTATLLNADKTNGYGFEANIDFAPTSEWLITLGGSYNHTKIDDPGLRVSACGGGCTILDPTVPGPGPFDPPRAAIDGNPLPNAPEWIFDGIVDYRRPAGAGLVVASFDWAYQSDKSFFLYESKEFHADSLELGLKVGYVFADARYEVNLFARNLADEEIVQGAIDFNNLTGMTNEPRTIGIQFIAHFGE